MKTLFPRPATSIKLFTTGATLGPIVDSFHNQCLLTYDVAPVSLAWPKLYSNMDISQNLMELSNAPDAASASYFFCSSWLIPPLLGFAYVVLGAILPRTINLFLSYLNIEQQTSSKLKINEVSTVKNDAIFLRTRAIQAVISTIFIIRLSEVLQTNTFAMETISSTPGSNNLALMMLAAVTQWALLDSSPTSLIAATITSIGGPLSELPFIAAGYWHYIPQAVDYFPLQNMDDFIQNVLHLDASVSDLALSSITGPCYFAVTMDAIALGRWFDSIGHDDNV